MGRLIFTNVVVFVFVLVVAFVFLSFFFFFLRTGTGCDGWVCCKDKFERVVLGALVSDFKFFNAPVVVAATIEIGGKVLVFEIAWLAAEGNVECLLTCDGLCAIGEVSI